MKKLKNAKKTKPTQKKEFDFIKNRKIFFTIPIILILVTIIGAIFMNINLDIKFKGGTIVEIPYSGDINLDDVQNKIQDSLKESVSIQKTESGTQQQIIVTLSENKEITTDQTKTLISDLKSAYPDNFTIENQNDVTVTTVSPQIGGEFFKKCIAALLVAFLALIVYIGIRFRKIGGISAGIMAIIGLFHDAVIAFMILVLFRFTLNDSFVAVLLTILGYSVNNTIVIYDRIRENSNRYPDLTIRTIVNKSINQTLSRSINTTFTTVLALVITLIMALIFHISSIVSFVLPLIFGILAGAYSSICVSGPLWVWWKEKRLAKNPKKKKAKKETKKNPTPKENEEKEYIEVRTSYTVNKEYLKENTPASDKDNTSSVHVSAEKSDSNSKRSADAAANAKLPKQKGAPKTSNISISISSEKKKTDALESSPKKQTERHQQNDQK